MAQWTDLVDPLRELAGALTRLVQAATDDLTRQSQAAALERELDVREHAIRSREEAVHSREEAVAARERATAGEPDLPADPALVDLFTGLFSAPLDPDDVPPDEPVSPKKG